MNNIQFIITVVAMLTIMGISILLYLRKKHNDSLVELNCEFSISDNTDKLLDTWHEQLGVEIDGILGNDFIARQNYIIDYKNMVVKHDSLEITIKEIMDIIGFPIIQLWQGTKRLVFLLDTGANTSLIHSQHIDGLKYVVDNDSNCSLYGYGGGGTSSKSIKTTLFYYHTEPTQ